MLPRNNSYGSYGVSNQKVNYVESSKNDFIAEYSKWNGRNETIYRTSFVNSNSIYLSEYMSKSSLALLFYAPDEIKVYKDAIFNSIKHMEGDIERVDLIGCTVQVSVEIEAKNDASDIDISSNDIFIVHGHDDLMKQTVACVVLKLGLNPIILHEQSNGGKTIIEKIEKNAESCNFAIVLLSDDDLGEAASALTSVKEEEIKSHLKKRARQNVIFEMGFFVGKISRSKTFLLYREGVERPSDISGVVYTSFDDAGKWKIDLVKELKNAGYSVSADDL